MGSAGTVRTATVVLCLLVGSSACSRQRSFVRRDDQPLASIPGKSPVVPETASLASMGQEAKCKIWTDCENFYRWDIARDLLLGVGAASLLANTSMDQDFRDWYQDDVKSPDTDHFADAWKTFGEGQIFIPAFAGLALVGGLCDHTACGGVVGEFGSRTTRAYLVGAPPMLFMQYALGGSRPEETKYQSRWRPFEDNNGVSGHAFVGAVPFISAAKMAENPWMKGGLYACSTLTAWSRIDHDKHYLSQAVLGWWTAYLASSAVDKTEHDYEHLTLAPVTTPEMVGIGLLYER